jgi:hypothetical protein
LKPRLGKPELESGAALFRRAYWQLHRPAIGIRRITEVSQKDIKPLQTIAPRKPSLWARVGDIVAIGTQSEVAALSSEVILSRRRPFALNKFTNEIDLFTVAA